MSDDGNDVTIRDVTGWPGWVFVVRLDHDRRTPLNEPTVVGLDVRAPDDSGPHDRLDADTFRSIPFGSLRRLALGNFFDPFVAIMAVEVQAERRPQGGGSSHSEQVAVVYRTALDQGFSAPQAIARHFEKSQKTADRWISEARRRGYLGTYAEEVAASNERMGEWKGKRR